MLVVGLGNSDRGDDAAGLLVAQRLSACGIEALQHTGSMTDLLDIWQNAEQVLIVDAIASGGVPGTVHVWNARTTEFATEIFRSSTHAFGLADLLKLATTLERLPVKVTIYGIEGSQFLFGTPPSVQVLAGVQRTIEEITRLLGRC